MTYVRLPFFEWMICEAISVDKEGELVFEFGRKHGKEALVEYKEDSFIRILSSHSKSNPLPVPAGYEAIAVKEENSWIELADEDGMEIILCSDYHTYVWDDFANISGQYGPRIASGESKEAIADEIMPRSGHEETQVLYLLRYIYHHRAFYKNLPFEEVWQKIWDTYRRFILMVLDCIPSSFPEK